MFSAFSFSIISLCASNFSSWILSWLGHSLFESSPSSVSGSGNVELFAERRDEGLTKLRRILLVHYVFVGRRLLLLVGFKILLFGSLPKTVGLEGLPTLWFVS